MIFVGHLETLKPQKRGFLETCYGLELITRRKLDISSQSRVKGESEKKKCWQESSRNTTRFYL